MPGLGQAGGRGNLDLCLNPLSQCCGSCSPSKGHQGHSGVGGPGEHEEEDDNQCDLGHLPLTLQPVPLPPPLRGLTAVLTGPRKVASGSSQVPGSQPLGTHRRRHPFPPWQL